METRAKISDVVPSASDQFTSLLEGLDALASAIQGAVESRTSVPEGGTASLSGEHRWIDRPPAQDLADASFEKEVIGLFALEAHEWLAQIQMAVRRLAHRGERNGASEALRDSLTGHYKSRQICVYGAASDHRTDGLESASDSPRCGATRTTCDGVSAPVASGGVGSDQSGRASISRRAKRTNMLGIDVIPEETVSSSVQALPAIVTEQSAALSVAGSAYRELQRPAHSCPSRLAASSCPVDAAGPRCVGGGDPASRAGSRSS